MCVGYSSIKQSSEVALPVELKARLLHQLKAPKAAFWSRLSLCALTRLLVVLGHAMCFHASMHASAHARPLPGVLCPTGQFLIEVFPILICQSGNTVEICLDCHFVVLYACLLWLILNSALIYSNLHICLFPILYLESLQSYVLFIP